MACVISPIVPAPSESIYPLFVRCKIHGVIRLLTEDAPTALTARKIINMVTFTDTAQQTMPIMAIKNDIMYMGRRPNLSPNVAQNKGNKARQKTKTDNDAFMMVSFVSK